MRRGLRFGLAAAGLIGGGAAAGLLAQEAKPARAAAGWEYRLVLLTDATGEAREPGRQIASLQGRFDELGREGWELAEINLTVAYFKRPAR